MRIIVCHISAMLTCWSVAFVLLVTKLIADCAQFAIDVEV